MKNEECRMQNVKRRVTNRRFCILQSAFCIMFLILHPSSFAADWSLTTADFASQTVDLRSIDSSGLTVALHPEGRIQQLSWEQVLQLERLSMPVGAPAPFVCQTSSGDQIAGEPVKVDQEALHWSNPALGEISVRLRQVRAIVRAGIPLESASASAGDDIVVLRNRDTVRGIVTEISASRITVQSAGSPVGVPMENVSGVFFAGTAPPATGAARGFRVRAADGSSLTVSLLNLDNSRLHLALSGNEPRDIDIAAVTAIEQVNGPVAWLSALVPSESVHTPLLETPHPARMDRTVAGEPIRFGDHSYARGIGVYPYSRLTWKLDGSWAALRTRYSIDGMAPYANLDVRILLDGQIVHERKGFTAGQLSPVIVVPVGSAKTLTFEVDFGQSYGVQGRFNWIEPALVKVIPSTQP
jgi:hypothetical protein